MPGPFGFDSHADFERAVNAEIEARSIHTNRPDARPGQQSPPPEQRAARPSGTKVPETRTRPIRVRGEAGSKERWDSVKAINPELGVQIDREQRLAQLNLLVDRWSQSQTSEYDRAVVEELARGSWDLQDMNVHNGIRQAIEQVGDEYALDYFDGLMEHRLGVAQREQQAQHEQADRARLTGTQDALADEYSRIERRLGTSALRAADEIAREIGDGLYEPGVDPEMARVAVRAAAEVASAQQRTGQVYETVSAIGQEMRRFGPAGGDQEREDWESRMQAADLEIADRYNARTDPAVAAERALLSRAEERFGLTAFEAELDAEIARMNEHSNLAPHREALHEANVEHWERTHDVAGRETNNLAEDFRR